MHLFIEYDIFMLILTSIMIIILISQAILSYFQEYNIYLQMLYIAFKEENMVMIVFD